MPLLLNESQLTMLSKTHSFHIVTYPFRNRNPFQIDAKINNENSIGVFFVLYLDYLINQSIYIVTIFIHLYFSNNLLQQNKKKYSEDVNYIIYIINVVFLTLFVCLLSACVCVCVSLCVCFFSIIRKS